MNSYVKNYGFTKTLIQDNGHNINNEIKWQGDYNGKIANIDVDINENGNRELVSMQLNNNDLKQIFGFQPVEMSLEKRLKNDFLSTKPITLEGMLVKRKTHKQRKRHKRSKSKRRH